VNTAYISVKNIKKDFVDRRKKPRSINDPVSNTTNIVKVIDDVSFGVEEGEIVCLLGPSGCGKTTLLRIIAGFERSYDGAVLIDGVRVNGPSRRDIFVFQHSGLFDWLTVKENVGLGLRNMEDKNEMNRRIDEYIDMVDLTGFEDYYPYQLSGGMLRRVELARAMAVNPDVLFMDEPFTGLDFLTHMRMREEVLNLHEFMKKTMIIVTHDIDDALIMGDRIIIFSERPAKLKMSRKLDFQRPRDYSKDEKLNALRSEIYLMLGVHHAL
jgi:ABC-type nitrate/sulfonate/bicarbonate transport system ATPase subunit